jgi:hypothetical protein
MLNQEAIDSRRVSIEDAQIKQYKPGVWQCHYCVKRFGSEAVFMRHNCEQKRRAQEIASPNGQAAYGYFTTWLKARKFKAQAVEAFMSSRYYRAFLKFAAMVVAAGISKPDRYVILMLENGITPDLWCRDACYKIYLDWMDKQEDPLEQVQSSVECLIDLAEKEGVDYREVLSHLGAQKVLDLIMKRKLSPWFLLHSTAVQKFLKTVDKEQLKNFDRAVNVAAWVERLEEHQHLRADIKHIIAEVGL